MQMLMENKQKCRFDCALLLHLTKDDIFGKIKE